MSEQGLSSETSPYSVADFTGRVSNAIKKWPTAWIEGELVKFKVAINGNAYPQLKDLNGTANIGLTVFASTLRSSLESFQDGDRVIVSGNLDFWPGNGSLSLKVQTIRKVGLGDLMVKLEELRQKLRAEGLIDESKRKPLPFLPKKIGLITGRDSDAEKDVIQNAKLRWSAVQFEVIHVPVKGESSPPAVIKAIQQLDADPEVDVIIIARGGGAFLDLIGFSDEGVVRAAAAANTPIVSAIGHEADRPILDDVADLRASTPTDAAKRVVPDVAAELAAISDARARMFNRLVNYVQNQTELVGHIRQRPMLANPYGFIDDKANDLQRAIDDLRAEIDLDLKRSVSALQVQQGVLRSLSPQGVLDRGYSVVRDPSGKVFSDAAEVKNGQKLRIRLAKGEFEATAND
jgi:exodeoxyribonuclease VII large subunit